MFTKLVFQTVVRKVTWLADVALGHALHKEAIARDVNYRTGEGCMWHTAEYTKSILCFDTRHSQEHKYKDPTKIFITSGDSK